MRIIWVLTLALLTACQCQPRPCATSAECGPGSVCSGGVCVRGQNPDGGGGGGNPGGDGGTGSDGGSDDAGTSLTLKVEPATAELLVTRTDQDVTQAFAAVDSRTNQPVAVTWAVSRLDLGDLDATGRFSTRSIVGGVVKIRAVTMDGASAEATLTIRVQLTSNGLPDGGGGVPANIVTVLTQTAQADAGSANGPRLLYPYANTVFPRGIIAPLLQYSLTTPPAATRVEITAPFFSWTGYSNVGNPQRPNATIPDAMWDAALRSASGTTFLVSVTAGTAAGGFGPTTISLTAAPGSLKGSVYYMTYAAAELGVWRVKTGTQEPPTHVVRDCTVCHAVSANGQRLVTGGENNGGGVFTLTPDAGLSRVSGPPPGLGGDSRGLSFATITPDGKYVLRSQSNFWGGVEQKAFKVSDTAGSLTEATVVGMGTAVAAFVPAVSPDGRYFAFTQGRLTPQVTTPSRALKVMDLSIDEAAGPAGTLTFSNERTLVDNGPNGSIVKFVTFLPNTKRLAYQESTRACTSFDLMLPTWDTNCGGGTRSPGRLMHVDATNTPPTVHTMTRANAGLAGEAEWQNYEPFALPFVAGGYYWVAFTSVRAYGNVFQGSEARKQLWVAAVNPNAPPGTDPSAPAFHLPNQLETENERGYWALDPCLPIGFECVTGDECCEGFCRAPAAGASRVCAPRQQSCSQPQERCRLDTDCCPVMEGPAMQCLAGFCTLPSPDAGIPEIQ